MIIQFLTVNIVGIPLLVHLQALLCMDRDMDAEAKVCAEDPIGLKGFSSESFQARSLYSKAELDMAKAKSRGREWMGIVQRAWQSSTQTCFDTGMADAGLEVHREHDRARVSDLSEKVRTLLS